MQRFMPGLWAEHEPLNPRRKWNVRVFLNRDSDFLGHLSNNNKHCGPIMKEEFPKHLWIISVFSVNNICREEKLFSQVLVRQRHGMVLGSIPAGYHPSLRGGRVYSTCTICKILVGHGGARNVEDRLMLFLR